MVATFAGGVLIHLGRSYGDGSDAYKKLVGVQKDDLRPMRSITVYTLEHLEELMQQFQKEAAPKPEPVAETDVLFDHTKVQAAIDDVVNRAVEKVSQTFEPFIKKLQSAGEAVAEAIRGIK